jgi:drug/metabolite transporter (DMT)-like permease
VLLVAYAMLWWVFPEEGTGGFAMPLGPDPVVFVGLMLLLGLFASWLGTVCWNAASQRLPPTLAGPLWPEMVMLAGIACLVLGVVWGVRAGATSRVAQT